MNFPVKETIEQRKSVRTFDGRPLTADDRAALERYCQTVTNPFDVSVEFRVLDAKAHDLSSPVIVGAEVYVAAKVARGPRFEIGYGYSFESFCLYAQSLGVGSVMLAASLSRGAFEQAMDLKEGEVMPVGSPLGYPADKRSFRETLMRKGLKADDRLPFSALFFDGDFDHPLRKDIAGDFADALEMARWAPSATNKQPWRVVLDGDRVHFFEKQTLKESALGDVQKIDMGIALAHFDLTMQEDGHTGHFVDADPGLALPERVQYIISYQREA